MKIHSSKTIAGTVAALVLIVMAAAQGCSQSSSASGWQPGDGNWPPKMKASYPDLEVIDQDGNRWNLSRFKGKVIIVEPIGMTCPACQAFAGAHKKGSYGNITPQSNLEDFETYFNGYTGGMNLNDDGIVLVELLLYDLKMGHPGVDDAKGWAEHFGMKTGNNHYVVVPASDMRNKATYDLIPGYQLIDKNFTLRSDSTGHNPRDDLWRVLLPMVPTVLFEEEGGAA